MKHELRLAVDADLSPQLDNINSLQRLIVQYCIVSNAGILYLHVHSMLRDAGFIPNNFIREAVSILRTADQIINRQNVQE